MTRPGYETEATPERPEERHEPCPDCDPDLLDELKCRAQGIDAQAKYNDAHISALTNARTQYDAARSAYSAARNAAAPTVHEVRQQLTQVIDQLQCLVDDRREIHLIDQAYARVEERLHACGDTSGCYFDDDCDFDDVHDCLPEDVPGRIAEIERRTKAAEACFADLIQEPTNLATRVTQLQAEVKDLMTKMGGDPKTTDFKQLYVAALVGQRHLAAVWRGFEHTNAYVDCLCRALTCQLKGHTAIAILQGRAAVQACHQQSRDDACKRLREHTVDEVMAEYIRARTSYPSEEYADQGAEDEKSGYRPDREPYQDRDSDQDRYGSQNRPRDRYRNHDVGRPSK